MWSVLWSPQCLKAAGGRGSALIQGSPRWAQWGNVVLGGEAWRQASLGLCLCRFHLPPAFFPHSWLPCSEWLPSARPLTTLPLLLNLLTMDWNWEPNKPLLTYLSCWDKIPKNEVKEERFIWLAIYSFHVRVGGLQGREGGMAKWHWAGEIVHNKEAARANKDHSHFFLLLLDTPSRLLGLRWWQTNRWPDIIIIHPYSQRHTL